MSNFNQVTLVGRLVADPELTTVGADDIPKATFRIAVNRIGKNRDLADFFDVETWRNTAEYVSAYQTKGKRVLVSGRLQLQQWETDGQKRSRVVVVGDNVQGFDYEAPATTEKQVVSTPAGSADDIPF